MTDQEWSRSSARCLGALISGRGLGERDERGLPVVDADLLLLLNANDGEVPFPLPSGRWEVLVDTSLESRRSSRTPTPCGGVRWRCWLDPAAQTQSRTDA